MTNEREHDLVREDCERVLRDAEASLQPLSGQVVLVTGGTGFVGTWLAEIIAYLNDYYAFDTNVILLSPSAHRFAEKVPHLTNREDIALLVRDVRSISDLPAEIGWIVHAAGTPDNRTHASDPIKTMSVIMEGTVALLEAATRLPDVRKILNVSSGLVNGPQGLNGEGLDEHTFTGLDCASVSNAYTEAKRIGETLCAAYRSQQRLPIVNARPFAFIGPYQHLDRPWAINNFIRDGLLGGPIRILGDGETVRSYMYPSDMAVWLLKILISGRAGASYNVGSSEGVTLRCLAEMVADNFEKRPKIATGVSQETTLRRSRFVPDTAAAQKELGLQTTVSLSEAVKRTILWNRCRSLVGK